MKTKDYPGAYERPKTRCGLNRKAAHHKRLSNAKVTTPGREMDGVNWGGSQTRILPMSYGRARQMWGK